MDSILTASTALPLDKILMPPVIQLLIMAGALFVVGALLRSPLVKGWLGELQVNIAARLFLDKRRYHLVKNVTVPSGDGTTQIDHVIVSRYGVLVVETKNMNGWIFGTERDAQWTQKFRKSSFRFQNPLQQNYKHTETLAKLLGLPRHALKSVIVFVGGAQMKKEVPANVTITGGYIRYIRSHKQEILSEEDVQRVLYTIQSRRLVPSLRTHRQHVEHVRGLAAAKASADTKPATSCAVMSTSMFCRESTIPDPRSKRQPLVEIISANAPPGNTAKRTLQGLTQASSK